MDLALFYLFAALTVVASVFVIAQRNPMYSVLLLILSFAGLSGLYVQLGSPFVAVIQIIIYAGAIMVLFLFVVMLLNVPREEEPTERERRMMGGDAATAAHVQSVRQVGIELFTTHAFAFEVTSVLILVAMVGAVVLAKKVL